MKMESALRQKYIEKNKFLKQVERNWIFIILAIVMLVCWMKRDSYLETTIVTHPDSQVFFATNQSVLEQTWQPNIKKISEISISYLPIEDFVGKFELSFVSDDGCSVLAKAYEECNLEKNVRGILKFSFDPFEVEPGVRYKIQLRYMNPNTYGGIFLDSGMNYMGCSIDGNVIDEAVAFGITFIKSSRIYWLFITFLPFVSFSLFIMILGKKKWEEVIGFSFVFTFLILYSMGMINMLQEGIKLIYIMSVLSLLFSVFLFNYKKVAVKELFSPAMLLYVVLILFILFNCYGTYLARWDEYTHWGLAAKDMFYYNSFSKHLDTSVSLLRYPPFSTLVEYFFTYTNGLFSTDLLYVGFQTAIVSMLIIVGKTMNRNAAKYLFPSITVAFVLPLLFFQETFNSLYTDSMLAVFFAYVLICYYSENLSLFNCLRIFGGLFGLTLTKETGVILAGLATLIMFVDTLYRQCRKGLLNWRKILLLFSFTIWVCFLFFGWQYYLSIPAKGVLSSGIVSDNAVSASGISLGGILEFLKLQAPQYRYDTLKNFIVLLFDEDSFSFGSLSFSFVDLGIVLIILTWMISYPKWWEDYEKRFFLFGILTFGAGLLYCGCLLVMYLFAFPEEQAVSLTSNARYLGSWMCGIVLAAIALFIIKTAQIKSDKSFMVWSISMIVCCLILMVTPVKGLIIKNMDEETPEELVYGYDDMAEVLRSFADREESVYFVCNNSNGYAYYMFCNAICPMKSKARRWDIYESKEAYQEQKEIYKEKGIEIQNNSKILSKKEWKEALCEYQYVFLFHPNEVFAKSYSELFEEPETIGDGTFYQVCDDGEEVVLHYIGSVGVKAYK